MSVPTTAAYTGYYALAFDEGLGTYTIGVYSTETVFLGDDENDTTPEDGSAGDGSELSGELLRTVMPGGGYNAQETYTGWTINGDPVLFDGVGYFLYSDSPGLIGQTGTATSGTYTYCFLPGTRISTPAGPRAIETLQAGDLVTTLHNGAQPVKWIGRMARELTLFNRDGSAPVCIQAGALGDGLPQRDLFVSPDHALLVDGVLVHASALVNGRTITRDDTRTTVTYLHIETAEHELVLAEGMAAETFIDNVSRARFDNAAEYEALYPEAQPMQELALPRVKFARQLPRVIARRLAATADALQGSLPVANAG